MFLSSDNFIVEGEAVPASHFNCPRNLKIVSSKCRVGLAVTDLTAGYYDMFSPAKDYRTTLRQQILQGFLYSTGAWLPTSFSW